MHGRPAVLSTHFEWGAAAGVRSSSSERDGVGMLRKSWFLAAVSALLLAGSALAGTFGKVVSIGGAASDLELDEQSGLLYIAIFTDNRVDVMSLDSKTIVTSINVAPQPSSISLSPNGRWLLTTHFGNN